MARLLTTVFLLTASSAFAHRLGDEGDDASAILRDEAERDTIDDRAVGFVDEGRPKSAPGRLDHLVKGKDGSDLMKEFWGKSTKVPRIIFADSGVGGLSIMSKFIELFRDKPLFKEANLIFFDTAGLNKDAHSEVVKDLLKEINNLEPDLLFIACNGMSAVYLESDDAKDPKFPVIQMLPFAVEYWGKHMEQESQSSIVQFVSEFTGNTYRDLMKQKSSILKNGIPKDRLIVQTCQDAITEIQDKGPDSESAKEEITKCGKDALDKLKEKDFENNRKLFLGMGCTHFAWADVHWKSAMEAGNVQHVQVLDPNVKMAQWLFDEAPKDLNPGERDGDGGIKVAVILRREYKMAKIKELVVKPLQDAIDAAKVMEKDSF